MTVVSLANVRRVENELRARRAERVADLLPSMIVAIAVDSRRPLPTTVTISPARNAEDDEALVRDAEYLAALVAQRQLELRQHANSLRLERFDDDTENDG